MGKRYFVTPKVVQVGASVLLLSLLTACGQSGNLYLTKQDIAQHQTVDQPQAPSAALQPMNNNQRVLNDV